MVNNNISILTGNLNSPWNFFKTIQLLSDQKLYESIRNEPFKIPEDDGNDLTHTFFNPDREGWLLKLGKNNNSMVIINNNN